MHAIDRMKRFWRISLLTAALWTVAGCGPSDNELPDASPDAAANAEAPSTAGETIPYPLTTCIVSGEGLEDHGEPHLIEHEGREVRFCCPDCGDSFKQNPVRFLEKLDRLAGTAAPPDGAP